MMYRSAIVLVVLSVTTLTRGVILPGNGISWTLAPPEVVLPRCNVSVVGSWTTVNSTVATASVRQFRGIPFAKPPVGNLRYANTVSQACPASPGGSFQATEFSQPCIQPLGGNSTMGAEDCLYLNVYVPQCLETTPTQLAPVLVYIHGGGLTGGSGIFEALEFLAAFAGGNDSASTVENAAVVVTINYRLAVLGFLATPAMCEDGAGAGAVCGNFGILDQIAALRWVQQHIAYFGGDPMRVNIMGQSSGGTSVFALMATPSAQGLFRSGISLSGSPNMTMASSVKFAQDAPLATALGCPNNMTSAAQMLCLRSLPAGTIQSAMPNSWNTPNLFSNRFLNHSAPLGEDYPALVYVDGTLITGGLWDNVARGVNGNVTLVFGNMGQECDIAPPEVPVMNYSQSEWKEFIAQRILYSWPHPHDMAEILYEIYRNASLVNPQFAYDSINADYGLTCATRSILQRIGDAIRHTRSAPMYVYLNQWGPQSSPPTVDFGNYAFHTWDYVNAAHNWVMYTPGEQDLELSRLQRRQWFQIWSNHSFGPEMDWPAVNTTSHSPFWFLFSRTDRFPFRPTGATTSPYGDPAVCPFLVDVLGLDERYWWVN